MIIILIAAVGAWYFLTGSGAAGGSRAEVTVTPSTFHVGDEYTMKLSVTNKESGMMTIHGATSKFYLDGQLVDETVLTEERLHEEEWLLVIPSGETKLIDSGTTSWHGGPGDYKGEISITTNYRTLEASCTWKVLPRQ